MVCQHNIQDYHDHKSDVDGVDHEVDHDDVYDDDVDHDDDALQPGGQAPSRDGLERQVLSPAPWQVAPHIFGCIIEFSYSHIFGYILLLEFIFKVKSGLVSH